MLQEKSGRNAQAIDPWLTPHFELNGDRTQLRVKSLSQNEDEY